MNSGWRTPRPTAKIVGALAQEGAILAGAGGKLGAMVGGVTGLGLGMVARNLAGLVTPKQDAMLTVLDRLEPVLDLENQRAALTQVDPLKDLEIDVDHVVIDNQELDIHF